MMESLHMPGLMPWVAAALSAVALALSIVAYGKKPGKLLLIRTASAAELLQDTDSLRRKISEMRDGMERLREQVSRRSTEKSVAVNTRHEVESPVRRFISLMTEWQRITGLKMRGSAIEDFANVQEDSPASFAAAKRLVEYVVVASGKRVATSEGDRAANLLIELAEMVKMELIEPERGERYDPTLHEVVAKFPAGASQPGTIAEVSVRGVNRGKGGLMKAKVCLYD